MSYILDALKKSDQQRQRGATPTLSATQVIAIAPKQPLLVYYGLLAAVLLGTGITVGWLRPWQAEQSTHAAEPIAARSPISITHQVVPIPLSEPPEMARKKAQELPVQNSAPVVQRTHRVDAKQSDILAPVKSEVRGTMVSTPAPMSERYASPADTAQTQSAITMAELPLPLQQEIPAMTIQLHAYSSKPMNRLVSINSRMLHEGESLTPGLKLEQITLDGMIFSYKGYRFQHGVR
ncbi:MAG: general secretion pathway protein GspB [Gallionella sp.]|nr:general secretion pathway protein GspB [Gallionella sp.]